jgi:hypothetical protein
MFLRLLDSPGDVRGLFVDGRDDTAGFVVKTKNGLSISDIPDDSPDQFLKVTISVSGDFTGYENETGGHQGFAGDVASRVLADEIIQDGIGDLITDFIRVTFSHRFRREKVFSGLAHGQPPSAVCLLEK